MHESSKQNSREHFPVGYESKPFSSSLSRNAHLCTVVAITHCSLVNKTSVNATTREDSTPFTVYT